ncbi:MAG: hypothetical protein LQ345_006789 [Seirophora villosa]|nr:MAG: hypothetical protein LQ345_006789 [Seirophora villosa]
MAMSSRLDTHRPAYKLVQRSRAESQLLPATSESDDDLLKPTSRLPPKPLPGRRKYWPFILVTLIALSTIIPLAILISKIEGMMPETYWSGLDLKGTSCDLVNAKNSSRLQSAFQINLRGAAQLSFGEAKLIDLVFDLLVGQGGRLLLAAVAYIVFMDALLRSMEITTVPYQLYTSLVFSSNSLIATWHSIRAVSTTNGWRGKAYLIWCALAMIYVLAFPTLIESATGYVSPSSPGFDIDNGTMVRADSNELISCLNVTGGLLFGLPENNTIAPGPPAHAFDPLKIGSGFILTPDDIPSFVNDSSLYYALLTAETDWVDRNSNLSTNSMSNDRSKKYPYYVSLHPVTNLTIDGRNHTLHDITNHDIYQPSYCYGDQVLGPSQLQQTPYCFTENYFVWYVFLTVRIQRPIADSQFPRGFSSIVLYVVLGLQILWTIGMYGVWLDANIASELVRHGRTIRGPLRAAADLVEAMNDTVGKEYCAYSDREVSKALQASGDRLRYESTFGDDELLHVGLSTKPSARVYLSGKKLYGSEDTARRRRVGQERQ